MENIPQDDITMRFLDKDGKIRVWPAKRDKQLSVLRYLSEKFEPGRRYAEREVNALIESWHTFGDLFLLRRGVVDAGLLSRTRNGSEYWRAEE